MATKIRLMRLGKMRAPYYRIVVADSRTKRDGRSIETIGKYHPKEDPSYIEVDSERALHWLKVGAQPTEPVLAILKITGDWQKFKGLPAPEPMRVKAPRPDKKAIFEEASRVAAGLADKPATTAKAKSPKKADEKAAEPAAAAQPAASESAAPAQPAAVEPAVAAEPVESVAPAVEASAAPEPEAAAPAAEQ